MLSVDKIIKIVLSEISFKKINPNNSEDLRQEVCLFMLEKEINEPGFINNAYENKWLKWWVIRVAMMMSKPSGKVSIMFAKDDNYHNEEGVNEELLNIEYYDDDFEIVQDKKEIEIEKKLDVINSIQKNNKLNGYEKRIIELYSHGVNKIGRAHV